MEVKRVIRSLALMPLLFLTACQSSSTGFPSFTDIWGRILGIASLGFLNTAANAEAFMRLMVFILVFAVFYEASRLTQFQPNIRAVISLVLAIISAVFMPAGVLAGIGITYGTITAFVLIGVPVLAGLYAIYAIPSTNRWLIGMKIAIIILLLIILRAVRFHALKGFGGTII